MFEVLRSTAQKYVKIQRNNSNKSTEVNEEATRDSGVVGDQEDLISEVSDSQRNSQALSEQTENDAEDFWLKFTSKGFSNDNSDGRKLLDDLLKSMTLCRTGSYRTPSNRSSMATSVEEEMALKRMSSSTVESSSNRNSWLKEEMEEDGSSQSSMSKDTPKSKSKKFKDHFKTMREKNKRKITRMLGSGKNKPVPISSVYPDSEENINRSSANDLANIFNGSSSEPALSLNARPKSFGESTRPEVRKQSSRKNLFDENGFSNRSSFASNYSKTSEKEKPV